ncbi:MAG: hypothetical protein DSY59_01615 [Persephonella sp.]|nr:MAG: hypothetical protein DSY59_01615 [Persephonella sp.]
MAREREKYFGEGKKKHTQIKHNICCETLRYSIYIANIFTNKNKWKQKYIYIDLFAGAGRFEDNSKGSIILALDMILSHLNSEKSKVSNNLYFEVIGIEKDAKTFKQLEENIKPYRNFIDINIENSDWEDFKDDIKKKLKNTKWGFIFADPFATELDLKKFLELVEVSNMQDFLVFLNINKVLRDLGKTNISEKEKERIKNSLKNFLMLDDYEILELESNKNDKEFIRNLIVRKLSGYKDFVIGNPLFSPHSGVCPHKSSLYFRRHCV